MEYMGQRIAGRMGTGCRWLERPLRQCIPGECGQPDGARVFVGRDASGPALLSLLVLRCLAANTARGKVGVRRSESQRKRGVLSSENHFSIFWTDADPKYDLARSF